MALDRSKPIYGRKSAGLPSVYKWQPTTSVTDAKGNNVPNIKTGCTATPYSHGEDYNNHYVYDVEIINGKIHRLAYVECGYVE